MWLIWDIFIMHKSYNLLTWHIYNNDLIVISVINAMNGSLNYLSFIYNGFNSVVLFPFIWIMLLSKEIKSVVWMHINNKNK